MVTRDNSISGTLHDKQLLMDEKNYTTLKTSSKKSVVGASNSKNNSAAKRKGLQNELLASLNLKNY